MTAYAKPADIETSLLRPLTTKETPYAADLLNRAHGILRGLVPALEADAEKDDDYRDTARIIEADMVARVLRNPDGFTSESLGDYTYNIDRGVASGRLAPTPAELERLRRTPAIRSAPLNLDGYARARYGTSSVHPFYTGG